MQQTTQNIMTTLEYQKTKYISVEERMKDTRDQCKFGSLKIMPGKIIKRGNFDTDVMLYQQILSKLVAGYVVGLW